MAGFVLMLLALCQLHEHALTQSNTIVFTGSTTAAPMTTPAGQMCTCIPAGTTCPGQTPGGIDIRIVNTGGNCSAGFTLCCSGGNIIDGSCGVRKIPPTAQPQGQASFGAYPWQAALLTPSNVYIGSGVLINQNHVLTVAHKVAAYVNGGFKVRLGEWNGQSVSEPYPYQEFMVSRVFLHRNFNAQNLQNDVAIIRLTANVPTANSPNINTACLPMSMPAAGTRCWVSGWGKNAFGPNGSYQSTMKEVDVPILNEGDCETALRGTRLGQLFVLDRRSFMCAGGEPGKDACTGDGGSPLVCDVRGRWTVIGMVAWGIGCANARVPGVYVNVFNFLPWINEQVNRAS